MKRKKKLRLRLPFRIILVLVAVFFVVTLYFPVSSVYKLMHHNYSMDASIEIYKRGMYEKIINLNYSEFIDKFVKNDDFDEKLYESYQQINYYNRDNLLEKVNKLIELKYSIDEINLINEKVSDEFYPRLLKEYVYDISKYLNINYFKEENFDRYKLYFNGDYEKTVLYVNIGLDKEYYEDSNMTSEFSTTMLVNKYNGVTKDFVVPDLVSISSDCTSDDNFMNKEAAEAFEKMCRAARSERYDILANSTYRDYDIQQGTWDRYLGLYGISYNNKYVAKPGFSEHHTGLAIDIKSAHSNIFEKSKEYNWTLENCHKYGFIHRYPKDKVEITGISSEAWHFRYVGVDIATYIYENNLSFEEYYAMFLDK